MRYACITRAGRCSGAFTGAVIPRSKYRSGGTPGTAVATSAAALQQVRYTLKEGNALRRGHASGRRVFPRAFSPRLFIRLIIFRPPSFYKEMRDSEGLISFWWGKTLLQRVRFFLGGKSSSRLFDSLRRDARTAGAARARPDPASPYRGSPGSVVVVFAAVVSRDRYRVRSRTRHRTEKTDVISSDPRDQPVHVDTLIL